MPGSRIEIDNSLNDDVLEALGAWTTNGNALLGGGGDLLGSTDNFGFSFITNNITRAGFESDGTYYLKNHGGGFNDTKYRETTFRLETFDAVPTIVFSFLIPFATVYKFTSESLFFDSTKTEWGGHERRITFRRHNVVLTGKEHASYTDTTNLLVKPFWTRTGNVIQLMVQGIAATSVVWAGKVSYQGVFQP